MILEPPKYALELRGYVKYMFFFISTSLFIIVVGWVGGWKGGWSWRMRDVAKDFDANFF